MVDCVFIKRMPGSVFVYAFVCLYVVYVCMCIGYGDWSMCFRINFCRFVDVILKYFVVAGMNVFGFIQA